MEAKAVGKFAEVGLVGRERRGGIRVVAKQICEMDSLLEELRIVGCGGRGGDVANAFSLKTVYSTKGSPAMGLGGGKTCYCCGGESRMLLLLWGRKKGGAVFFLFLSLFFGSFFLLQVWAGLGLADWKRKGKGNWREGGADQRGRVGESIFFSLSFFNCFSSLWFFFCLCYVSSSFFFLTSFSSLFFLNSFLFQI